MWKNMKNQCLIRKGEKKLQKSIIELLIEERKKNIEEGQKISISNEELIDEIKTFVIAGSETTSNFLVAMIFFVFEKPEVSERLRK